MIVPMDRVEVLGRRDVFRAALEFLQARGVLELRATAAPGVAALRASESEAIGAEAPLEEALRRIHALSARLPSAGAGSADPFPPPGSEAFLARLSALEDELARLEARRAALLRERDLVGRFARLVVALAPLGQRLDEALEPQVYGLVLEGDPAAVALLEAEVRRFTGGACEVKARALDAGTTGVIVVVPRASEAALKALLGERGVEEVKLPAEYAGKRLVPVLFLLAARERALPGEIARAEDALSSFTATAARTLAAARGSAAATLARRRAAPSCGETRFAFVISGYMPASAVPALRAAAAAELGDAVAVLARPPSRSEWGDVPVVVRNPSFVRPFRRLLALVPPPRYGSVDPTPWLAVFFPLFFGLVLGDVAFGAVGVAAALLVRRAGWGGAVGRDLAGVALWCSLSAAAFGLLFGEAFGELGAHAGLRPLLLDRRHAFVPFLGLTLALGAVHVGSGMALGLASALRAGRRREAIARAAKLLLLATAAAVAGSALGILPRAALAPLAAAGAALLGIALLAEGPLAALELVLGLGNVLSYARLMALGLASVMFAAVANRVAATLEPAAVGLALGVLLHAVNYTLCLVSPVVAALRLHYVEFFEKFYEEGGPEFRPFALPR